MAEHDVGEAERARSDKPEGGDGGPVVGIDLGTTNSAVAVVSQGQPHLVRVDDSFLLPSVVGKDQDGNLIVGEQARNQYALFPERTVRSVKRRMGENIKIPVADQELSPEEISAAILRRLKRAAEAHLGCRVERAVITVPAYFSDAQRTATREAGEIAGFKVERIINEPTAAALCYVESRAADRTLLVYDLGGGTFDVSVVRISGELVEVLASHGDTALGGDDMDASLMTDVRNAFESASGASLEGDRRAQARLLRACEEAKIRLSTESFVRLTEEHLAKVNEVSEHLDREIQRHEYEALINHLIERTKDSVQVSLREAGLSSSDLDEVVLVGGATRTPRVAAMLHDVTGHMPRVDVNPDEAVALGAALQAARIAGEKTDRLLVDVSPFSFGTSYFGELNGIPYPECYRPIIRRNTPLPTRQTEVFYTMFPGQVAIDVKVFQGEDSNALNNTPIGRFKVEGLDRKADEGSPILFDLRLNLDGILEVEVVEKRTGLKKAVTIADAFRKLSAEEIREAREKLTKALGESDEDAPWLRDADPEDDADDDDEFELGTEDDEPGSGAAVPSHPVGDFDADQRATWTKAGSLLEKAHTMMPTIEGPDKEEVEESVHYLRTAMEEVDWAAIEVRSNELGDILFYLE